MSEENKNISEEKENLETEAVEEVEATEAE